MRRIALAAVLWAGCAAPPEEPAKPRGGCACERKICACPHCKGDAPKCPCKGIEKPK